MYSNQHSSMFVVLFSLLVLIPFYEAADSYEFTECIQKEYNCGGQQYEIYYPFRLPGSADYCGHPGFDVACNDANTTLLANFSTGKNYTVKEIDYAHQIISVIDPSFAGSCPGNLTNYTLNSSLLRYSGEDVNVTVFLNCSSAMQLSPILHNITCLATETGNNSFYVLPGENSSPPADVWKKCSAFATIPIYQDMGSNFDSVNGNILPALQAGFSLQWEVGGNWCKSCNDSGGLCWYNISSPNAMSCYCSDNTTSIGGICVPTASKSRNTKTVQIAIGSAVGGMAALIAVCYIAICWNKRRKRLKQSVVSSFWSTSSKLSSKKDPEWCDSRYHTHIFSYDELLEATDGFATSRELGEGGFGTVYKGELRDGRTVAVKRLYEHNCRRLEQFMNEVGILSQLRHKNLVTLYGCTSRHSRELLLVYEFVPNGTVADHLHGTRASAGPLPWNVRMSIAIETADALSYLHATEPQIIHRDIKSNNILLDDNFHVKVADFGLSRLFPLDVTHVSTAPQGTPGYVDPEYHQCYHLTDKSDVYSFGVVLVELISSKPAVDIYRTHREINLSNMAVAKIQNRQLDQLVDPVLGYQSDLEVTRMVAQVAELAFACLQLDRGFRPSIKEVLEVLRRIESGSSEMEKCEVSESETKDSKLLNASPFSPMSVTERWQSRTTTRSNSG